ncbi:TPA: Fe-S cluster protein [Candidatus Acetothermia bacterium]|nr:Fe-S cluster protein [Candidatus Acetothermia bacterium]HAZ30507.1 Fe-S cluster protein [Candidatus Acetothermia bacterium]
MSGYEEVILDHWRHPRNKGRLHDPTGAAVEANPLCGDVVRMEVQVENGTVVGTMFSGEGCAISQSAASLLTEIVQGKPAADAAAITDEELLTALGGVVRTRLTCALLPLKALRKALAAARRAEVPQATP